ncbi:MAG: acyl carrier protein [Fibrobacteraceae bacterium]|nr:acyl carrier protein [Fibrobacteraceae bacterium]
MNTREQLLETFRQVLETPALDETASQKTCAKWDSIHHLNLIVALETTFDISLEPEEMAEMTDFETALRLVEGKKG